MKHLSVKTKELIKKVLCKYTTDYTTTWKINIFFKAKLENLNALESSKMKEFKYQVTY